MRRTHTIFTTIKGQIPHSRFRGRIILRHYKHAGKLNDFSYFTFLSGKIALNESNLVQPAATLETRKTAEYALTCIFAYTYSYFSRTATKWNGLLQNVLKENAFFETIGRLVL